MSEYDALQPDGFGSGWLIGSTTWTGDGCAQMW
jgi:hypothetical protein